MNLMVQTCGQQSVEVTKEVFMDMNRTDLVERLSETSSGPKEKHLSKQFQKKVNMTSLQRKLFETLEDLSFGELQQFKCLLQHKHVNEGLPRIPRHQIEMADRFEIVELMVEIYGQQSVEVTREVLKKMSRTDLVQKLSDISSGSKGPSRSLELEACGTIMDSSDWTKLIPEVNSKGAEEAPTYSLQSEAGNHFECSVSGLRWACKEKVSFRYQFCSWEEPMERMENIKYIPAGPLMDITVIAGRFDDVYLPHWICIDDVPKISDKFAVLHIDDCGDVVEKVSEVTSSHVKLSEPVFSPRAVLMKVGIPVKINCKVLIYQTNTAFLTLHVYLIPRDPGLQEAMDKMQLSYGYKVIRKPHPEKSLKMRDHFILTADLNGAKISPKDLKLRYESRDPNFFEVYIENPDRNFTLNLAQKVERQPVWTNEIRKDEYQSTDHIQVEEMGAQSSTPGPSDEEHFVDKHQMALIKRVSSISPILDELLFEKVLLQESYGRIRALATSQDKMRELYSGCLKAGGACKDIFYEILERNEPYLIADLKQKK
ncbi:NACHT, LRR and PYD domains-containing protein 1 homolog isoform X2 [Micropterus salmoides]|uniref:NACHT, LRR and PYD domains-containing protein 1 homolog isoform X2 n=1 Tax=Micropterus salmoides TaxID=27706 RepID=UPI0018EC2DF0|nr:NACHT, LRR and PYD domains-containing protein 1 homolog isoform X2 [Micropterus salmoides]